MKKLLLVTLILFSIFKAEAQCGSFPLSVSVPTLTCASPTGSVIITTTVSPVSCVWQGPGIVSGGNTLNPVVNVGGIYAFTITNTTNSCNAVYNINVQSPLNVTSPWLSCSTTTAVMHSNPSFTPTSYFWTGPGIVSSNTTNTITVNATGYYICTISNTVTGCQVSGSGSVSSNTFVPTITCNNSTINCANPSTNLIASSPSFSPALLNFSWQGSGIIAGATTQTATINAAGVYTCFVTNTLNGCVTSTTGSVLQNTIMPSITAGGGGIICSGQTATLTASSMSSVSYSWVPSIGLSSTTNSVVYASAISGTYTITVTDITNGCSSFASINIAVASTPTITVNNATVCVGTSTILTASGSSSSYSWNTGASKNSISISPTTNTSYTVIGTNACGYATATITIPVNQTCQDVWPGDVNSDGLADNLDILELGLHFNQTGTPRTTTSNMWQSYYANNWSGTITNGKNVNHSNCNGDGIINDDDTLAIYNNYSLTHAFKPSQSTTNPQLTIVPDQSLVAKGTWGTSSIYLADATTPINTINGLAFTVNFDNTLIDPNSIYIDYQNSFIDVSHQNLYFRKLAFSSGKIYTATTHTVNNNVSGFGKIATLHYKILSSLNTDQVFNISLGNANKSSALGSITPLTSGTATLMAIGASVGLEEFSSINSINVSPNPTNGLVTIKSKLALEKIEVINITGQIIINESVHSNNHILHLDGLVNGVYFLNIYQDNHIVKREKVIVNR